MTSKEEGTSNWLASIPVGWEIKRLKWSIKYTKNGVWGNDSRGDDNDIACVRVADFDRIRMQVTDVPTIRNVLPSERVQRIVNRGDLLLEKSGGGERQPVGAVAMYLGTELAICSNFIARLESAQGVNPRYFLYMHAALYAARINHKSIKQTSGIQNLDAAAYFSEPVFFPPLVEQILIADFLDHETAEADALVAKYEQLIELLEEKRVALITQAVTKGLDPSVPMKDIDVEWIKKLPAHWPIVPLKFLVDMKSGEQITGLNIKETGKYPVFGGGGFRGFTDKFTHVGDFVLIGRQGALCGNINYVSGAFWASEHAVVVSPKQTCVILWLGELLRSMNLGQYSATAAQPGLSIEALGNLRIPVPPLEEQEAISFALNANLAMMRSLTDKVRSAIALVREHRSALISTAVTGQIDLKTYCRQQPTKVAAQ